MSKFGWSYPPGAASDPSAPYNQNGDVECDVCGKCIDDCICPECPVCKDHGDPRCYERHGLVRTPEQIASRAAADKAYADAAAAESVAITRDYGNPPEY